MGEKLCSFEVLITGFLSSLVRTILLRDFAGAINLLGLGRLVTSDNNRWSGIRPSVFVK
jgi:hypothetical protein